MPDKRGITAAYYNSVRYLDDNIGAVIALLKKYGFYDDTYWSTWPTMAIVSGITAASKNTVDTTQASARSADYALAGTRATRAWSSHDGVGGRASHDSRYAWSARCRSGTANPFVLIWKAGLPLRCAIARIFGVSGKRGSVCSHRAL